MSRPAVLESLSPDLAERLESLAQGCGVDLAAAPNLAVLLEALATAGALGDVGESGEDDLLVGLTDLAGQVHAKLRD